jgi:hypothetical protein
MITKLAIERTFRNEIAKKLLYYVIMGDTNFGRTLAFPAHWKEKILL